MNQALYLLFVIPLCNGVIQEVTFHESNTDYVNNSYTYRQNVPDMSQYPFQKVIRFCHNTNVLYFTTVNYGVYYSGPGNGCRSMYSNIKSFRFVGNRDTNVDGISAFSGVNWTGDETYVDHSPFVIHTPIKSVGYTGKSNWTVFESDNFAGKTACLPAGSGTVPTFYADLNRFNITTIGSMFKGCGALTPEIIESMRQQVRAKRRN